MNNWQPINTAPKDRRILLACEDREIVIAKTSSRGGFIVGDEAYEYYYVSNPIAWQELPVFDGVSE